MNDKCIVIVSSARAWNHPGTHTHTHADELPSVAWVTKFLRACLLSTVCARHTQVSKIISNIMGTDEPERGT